MKRFLALCGLLVVLASCGGGGSTPPSDGGGGSTPPSDGGGGDKWLDGEYSILYNPVTQGGAYSIVLSDNGTSSATGTTTEGSTPATITIAYTGTYNCQSVTIAVEGDDPSVCTTCKIGENGTHLSVSDCALPGSIDPTGMDLYKAPGTNALTGEYVGTVDAAEVTLEMSEKDAAGAAATTGGVYSSGTASYENRGFVVVFSTDYATCNAYFEDDGALATCSSCDIPEGTGNSIEVQCAGVSPAPVEFRKRGEAILSGKYGVVYSTYAAQSSVPTITMVDNGLGQAVGPLGDVDVKLTYESDYSACTASVGGTACASCGLAASGEHYDITLTNCGGSTAYFSYLPATHDSLAGNYPSTFGGASLGTISMTEATAAVSAVSSGAYNGGEEIGTGTVYVYYSTNNAHCNMKIISDGSPEDPTYCTDCAISQSGDHIIATCTSPGGTAEVEMQR